jgi:hypothetical protein
MCRMDKSLILFVLFFYSITFPQAKYELGMTLGLTNAFQNKIFYSYPAVSPRWRHYSYIGPTNTGHLFCANASVFLNLFCMKYFVPCLEFAFNQKGCRYEMHAGVWNDLDYVDSMWVEETRLSYLSLAIKGKPRVVFKRFEVFLLFGLSLDLAVSKRSTYLEGVNNKFKNYDISIPFGLGIGYAVTKKMKIQIEFQPQPGIIDNYMADSFYIKNEMIRVNVGLVFSFLQ